MPRKRRRRRKALGVIARTDKELFAQADRLRILCEDRFPNKPRKITFCANAGANALTSVSAICRRFPDELRIPCLEGIHFAIGIMRETK